MVLNVNSAPSYKVAEKNTSKTADLRIKNQVPEFNSVNSQIITFSNLQIFRIWDYAKELEIPVEGIPELVEVARTYKEALPLSYLMLFAGFINSNATAPQNPYNMLIVMPVIRRIATWSHKEMTHEYII